jgi:hypothetical protein
MPQTAIFQLNLGSQLTSTPRTTSLSPLSASTTTMTTTTFTTKLMEGSITSKSGERTTFLETLYSNDFHRPSALRKELDVVTDPKYRGQRVSRKDIDVDVSSDSRTGSDESEGESGSDNEETAHGGLHGRPSSTVDEDESSESDEDDTIQATDAFQDLNSTRNQDIIKGKAVSLQLVHCDHLPQLPLLTFEQKLWDMIIDARIRLQKAVIAANRLPDVRILHHDHASKLTGNQDKVLGAALESDAPRKSVKRLYEEAFGLSDDILKLRKVSCPA